MPDWPHGPLHRIAERGIYFVTAGTYLKEHYYREASALDELQELLFLTAQEHRVDLHAWALLSNHYHLVLETEQPLQPFFRHLHSVAARERNRNDDTERRKAGWFEDRAERSFVRMVQALKIDKLNVLDDFTPLLECGGLPPL
jgi:REP element-mobilizing transposase RayT